MITNCSVISNDLLANTLSQENGGSMPTSPKAKTAKNNARRNKTNSSHKKDQVFIWLKQHKEKIIIFVFVFGTMITGVVFFNKKKPIKQQKVSSDFAQQPNDEAPSVKTQPSVRREDRLPPAAPPAQTQSSVQRVKWSTSDSPPADADAILAEFNKLEADIAKNPLVVAAKKALKAAKQKEAMAKDELEKAAAAAEVVMAEAEVVMAETKARKFLKQ